MRWVAVDKNGHVPGIAAELPKGHEVLLDESNRIADMQALPQAQTFVVTGIDASTGDEITESVTLPASGSGTVTTTHSFSSIGPTQPLVEEPAQGSE